MKHPNVIIRLVYIIQIKKLKQVFNGIWDLAKIRVVGSEIYSRNTEFETGHHYLFNFSLWVVFQYGIKAFGYRKNWWEMYYSS